MARKSKPNFTPFGNKRPRSPKGSFEQAISDLFAPSKRFEKRKNHHDSFKGNRGNGGGKKR